MDRDSHAPGEGGVKIVFDVPDDQVDQIVEIVGAGSFAVRRYYDAEDWHRPGGAARGFTRLGAERPRHSFSRSEEAAVLAAFEALQVKYQLPLHHCRRRHLVCSRR